MVRVNLADEMKSEQDLKEMVGADQEHLQKENFGEERTIAKT